MIHPIRDWFMRQSLYTQMFLAAVPYVLGVVLLIWLVV
jgi:hypothetical protein